MGLSSRGTRGVLVLLAARACHLRGGESNARGGGEEEMRIADILREEEDEQCCGNGKAGGGGRRGRRWGRRRKRAASCSSSSSSSRTPRCLLSRWLPSKQLLKCRTCGEEWKDEDLVEEVEVCVGFSCLTLESAAAATAEGSASASVEEEGGSCSEAMAASSGGGEIALAGSEGRDRNGSEWKPEQTCLNIGMGAGLLFLLTRSITEFNKMTELRKEMEVLVKEIKEGMQRKDESSSSGESKNNLTFCGNSWDDTEQSNDLSLQDCNPCLELVKTSCDTEPDNPLKYNRAYKDITSPRIDEIEAELVSELELLQLNLDKQDSPEQLGAEFSGETTDPSERFSVSLGGNYDHKEWAEVEEEEGEDDDTSDHYGVCPHELTRRLHELVETRQQERIVELESALELAHIRLHEKEMEVCSWRDAAQLVSQNEE